MKNLQSALCLVALLLATACSGDNGSAYVGRWVAIKDSRYKIEFKKNGKNFTADTEQVWWPVGLVKSHETAVFKDGAMRIDGGMDAYTLVKDSDHLIRAGGGMEYVRQK